MSDAFLGVGTLFQRSDGASSGGTYSTIAEVNSIELSGMSREIIDVTSLDSTDGWREKITGLRDGGTVTVEMNFSINSYDDFLTDFNSDTANEYRIVMSDTGATTFDFDALVTGIPFSVAADNKVTASVTLEISGPVTMTT